MLPQDSAAPSSSWQVGRCKSRQSRNSATSIQNSSRAHSGMALCQLHCASGTSGGGSTFQNTAKYTAVPRPIWNKYLPPCPKLLPRASLQGTDLLGRINNLALTLRLAASSTPLKCSSAVDDQVQRFFTGSSRQLEIELSKSPTTCWSPKLCLCHK